MSEPIDVDEARKALEELSDSYHWRDCEPTISAALDRLEELEANPQGVYIPEAREAMNKLIRNKSVSLQEASFLSTAINRAEEVPALSMERKELGKELFLIRAHRNGLRARVDLLEAEREALKARLAELESPEPHITLQSVRAELLDTKAERDAAQGQCAEAARAATQNNGALKARVQELEARPQGIGDGDIIALFKERDVLKARVAQLEGDHSDGEKTLLASLHTALDERDNLMAQLEKLQKLFCDKCVWEACGDCASCQKERADSVEAECDVLKARMKELERERDCWKTACGRDSLKMFEVMGERDALRAQLETAKGLLTVLVAEWKDPRLESLVNAKTFLSSKEGGE